MRILKSIQDAEGMEVTLRLTPEEEMDLKVLLGWHRLEWAMNNNNRSPHPETTSVEELIIDMLEGEIFMGKDLMAHGMRKYLEKLRENPKS